jgi:hypothetical protein
VPFLYYTTIVPDNPTLFCLQISCNILSSSSVFVKPHQLTISTMGYKGVKRGETFLGGRVWEIKHWLKRGWVNLLANG